LILAISSGTSDADALHSLFESKGRLTKRSTMPKRSDISKILVIGGGPTVIGQGGELDVAATQACQALRDLDYSVIAVNANPLATMTDRNLADATYIEPLNKRCLKAIIETEKPDALLPLVGGQAALSLAYMLHEDRVLAKADIQLMGGGIDTIRRSEDRKALATTARQAGVETANGQAVTTVEAAESVANQLGYPVVIRSAYSAGGSGAGMVYNVEELRTVAAEGLAASLIDQVMVGSALTGWQEFTLVMARDVEGIMTPLACIENIDPVGIHSGDAIAVTPPQTLSDKNKAAMIAMACRLLESIGLIGTASVRLARDPATGFLLVLSTRAGVDRSAGLATVVSGVDTGALCAKLAVGLTLEELPLSVNPALAVTDAFPVVVKVPCWDFDVFEGATDRLGPRMQSTAEALGVGGTFVEALHKALRASASHSSEMSGESIFHDQPLSELMGRLGTPTSQRLQLMFEALRQGAGIGDIHRMTHIRPWFLEAIKQMVAVESAVAAASSTSLPADLLRSAKQCGYSDQHLAQLCSSDALQIRRQRESLRVVPAWRAVGKGATHWYATYNTDAVTDEAPSQFAKGAMILLGPGPNRIGKGSGFDHNALQAIRGLRERGIEAIVINPNSASVLTMASAAARCYIEPLDSDSVSEIYLREKASGLIPQFGGQGALDLAFALAAEGLSVAGTATEVFALAKDRATFREKIRKMGFPQPKWAVVADESAAVEMAEQIGYPVMLRWDERVEIVYDAGSLGEILAASVNRGAAYADLLIEQFLDNALEAEVDAISDGNDIFVPTIMEHIELAGIHSGDSACVIPAVGISPKLTHTIEDYTRQLAQTFEIKGCFNIQFAVYHNTVYLLEIKPLAARSVPLVSKVCHVPLARMGARLGLGDRLADLELPVPTLSHFGVKEAVFSYHMITDADPVLGPGMRSTGGVLGLAETFGQAFSKSQAGTGVALPTEGAVLFTILDEDKPAALEPARLFTALGFTLLATPGTSRFFAEHGIEAKPVRKLGYGRPDLVDAIKSGQVQLVVNTPGGRHGAHDNAYIRQTAVRFSVLNITTTAMAIAAARGIAAQREGDMGVRDLQTFRGAMVDSC
jgi:carbamoyl-phosphate synthase large subunit